MMKKRVTPLSQLSHWHWFMAGYPKYGGKGSVCVGVGTGSDSMIRVLTREGTLAISPCLSPRPNKTRDTS